MLSGRRQDRLELTVVCQVRTLDARKLYHVDILKCFGLELFTQGDNCTFLIQFASPGKDALNLFVF